LAKTNSLTVLFDNRDFLRGLDTAWGFACLVRTPGRTILFDTGSDGRILRDNMARLGIDPRVVEMVFVSHNHWDHTGGLSWVVDAADSPPVFVPRSAGRDIEAAVAGRASVIPVATPQTLCGGVWSSGELGGKKTEHALVVDTDHGMVVVTGCAHPGIVNVVEEVHRLGQGDIALLIGGFHLRGASAGEVHSIAGDLKRLWVQRIAPTHCTGDRAIEILSKEFGPDCVATGAGSSHRV
jgi:7,8-dihydropterin-6-yl-methyl-4-(beta-D-ribofuranosyl)aminobenzene 5'-phosphate synthase